MSDPFAFDRPLRFAVMGNPVEHSKSPAIHARFARQCGIRLEYDRIQVDPGGFAQALDHFRARGGNGLNITVPFKLEAWSLADRRSPRAELAGAVNTLRFDDDGLFGDNTDGVGLVRDLVENLRCPLAGRRILVLGAGGAARGILGPLLEARPEALRIANRTVSRAHELAERFATHGPVTAGGLDQLNGAGFDVVINATAASLDGALPKIPPSVFAANGLACDLMYGDQPTAFLAWAADQGVTRLADGLGMLVEQAAESFLVWLKRRPLTKDVLVELRANPAAFSEAGRVSE
ncbi:MAG: shikimate dehydrogenase [Gammaproteobacteria bacterium]|jgi:shikimate dehydrogenase|nr:shikimate dehydrogenase [Gammaproteobacteria bacterium]